MQNPGRAALLALALAAAAPAFAVTLPPHVAPYTGADLDGTWSATGTLQSGTCTPVATLKFEVRRGRIFMDGMSHGGYYSAGSSKLFGVVHQDRTVDLTIVDRNGRGRTSHAVGRIDANGELQLTDPGGCTYAYKGRKG